MNPSLLDQFDRARRERETRALGPAGVALADMGLCEPVAIRIALEASRKRLVRSTASWTVTDPTPFEGVVEAERLDWSTVRPDGCHLGKVGNWDWREDGLLVIGILLIEEIFPERLSAGGLCAHTPCRVRGVVLARQLP